MALCTKCILEPIEKDDGVRISVMLHHNHPDGKTPDSRITKQSYEKHLSLLAPAPELLSEFHRKVLTWDAFRGRFVEQLANSGAKATLQEIAKMSLRTNVTLLSIERDHRFSSRRIVAEECQRLVPGILVINHF